MEDARKKGPVFQHNEKSEKASEPGEALGLRGVSAL
jgi:hypothetical protein